MSGRRFGHRARLLGITEDPTSTDSGDVWFREDHAQLHASDGEEGLALTIGPGGNLPVIRSEAWHNLPAYGNASSVSVADGRLYALPFWPGRTCLVTAVAINVTIGLLAGDIRLGLYKSDGVLPTDLVDDYGTVSTGTTGIKQIGSLSNLVRPVLHYLVVGRQGGVGTVSLSARSSWEPIVSDDAPTIASNTNTYYIDGVNGALPAVFGTPDGTDQGPCVTVQLT